jgi:predicted membrane protein (TIGR00267 family)
LKYILPSREIIFGLEDGIVSTLGVVVGIAAGTDNRYLVILTALVLIIVESLSMAAGTYLSDKSELEIAHASESAVFRRSVSGSAYMFLSYIVGGLVSVFPFFFISPSRAIFPSVLLSVLFLFTIGFVKGHFAHRNKIISGLEMSLVSLSAAGIGFLIGKLASTFIPVNPI